MNHPITVLTADIIASSKLNQEERSNLQLHLKKVFEIIQQQYPTLMYELFRGDSVQIAMEHTPESILRVSLLLQTHLLKEGFGIRSSIGVGSASFISHNLITSDGSAFHLSGTGLDLIKKENEFILIQFEDKTKHKEWIVHSLSLSAIIRRWTNLQAEAVFQTILGKTQEQIAQELNLTQSSITQRLKAADWNVTRAIIHHFQQQFNV